MPQAHRSPKQVNPGSGNTFNVENMNVNVGGNQMVADGRGILLFATDAQERFRITRPLSAEVRADIARSGQFGDAPLSPSRYRFGDDMARGPGDEDMLLARVAMPLAGWQLLHVVPTGRTLRVPGPSRCGPTAPRSADRRVPAWCNRRARAARRRERRERGSGAWTLEVPSTR